MNTLHRIFTFFVFCTSLTAFQAHAASHISEKLGAVPLYHGTYIDWNTNGVSMEFDSGPGPGDNGSDGSFFMFHTYDQAGNQINWIGQPEVVSTSEADRLATGVIAHATGQLYYATNGPCIGCAPRPPNIVYTGIEFLLEWTSSRAVTLTMSGAQSGVFHLTAVNYASASDDKFLPGTWSATVVADSVFDPPEKAALAVVKIDALAPTVHFVFDPNVPAGHHRPPATARLYRLSCPADGAGGNASNRLACGAVMQDLGEGLDVIVWHDPVSGISGIEAGQFQGGAYKVTAEHPTHYDFYISGPNLLTGHSNSVLANGDISAQVAVTLVRIPDNTMRDPYDYSNP